MKNKKIMVICCLLVVLLLAVIVIIGIVKNKDKSNSEDKEFKISYSYNTSWGTEYQSWMRTITVDNLGLVTIKLTDNNVDVEPISYEISRKTAKDLYEYFVNNNFKDLNEDLTVMDLMDGGTFYLEVESSFLNKKVGGYGANESVKFSRFSERFWKIVDVEKADAFNESVEKAYKKKSNN